MFKKIRVLINIIAPILILYWIVKNKPWVEIISRLEGKSLTPILAAIFINFFICFTLKTIRWKYLLSDSPRFFSIYVSNVEGALANTIVGFGMNDMVRSYRLRGHSGLFIQDVGASFADRACEYLALMLIFSVVVLLKYISLGWGLLPLSYFIILLILVFKSSLIISKIDCFPKVQVFIKSLSQGLTPIRMTHLTILSLINWITELFMIHLVLISVGISSSPGITLLVLMGINIAISVPGPPANLGVFELGAAAALSLVGVNSQAGFSFGILYHLIHAVPVVVIGAIIWITKDIMRSRLIKKNGVNQIM